MSTERNGRICLIAQMRWLHDFITEMACCLKLRWESKVTLRSFRVVEEEGIVVPAMFIEDGGDRVCAILAGNEQILTLINRFVVSPFLVSIISTIFCYFRFGTAFRIHKSWN